MNNYLFEYHHTDKEGEWTITEYEVIEANNLKEACEGFEGLQYNYISNNVKVNSSNLDF